MYESGQWVLVNGPGARLDHPRYGERAMLVKKCADGSQLDGTWTLYFPSCIDSEYGPEGQAWTEDCFAFISESAN